MKIIGKTSSDKPIYAAFQLHRSFDDWTIDDHIDAAEAHRAAALTDIKTNVSMHANSAVLHEAKAQQLQAAVERLGLVQRVSPSKRPVSPSAPKPARGRRRTSPAQLDRDIAEVLATKPGDTDHARKKKQPIRVAYRLQLTPNEMRAVEFARGRYAWPDMLSTHVTEGGLVAFTEPEMWQWTDDVDSDTEGGHSPFALASDALSEKLQRFYDERV